MCGIVGIVAADAGHAGASPVPEAVLRQMADALAHRGPDGEGFHFAPGIGLGHRRLAVIDLAGGAQPMSIDGGAFTITFNGEIYNHQELRKDLEAEGHRFSTRSDTEVLLRGFATWREGVLERIRGMYAFAVFDRARRRLVMARDPLGEKPLYYAQLAGDGLVFASEAQALLRHPQVEQRVDPAALASYLTCEYLPGGQSMLQGVRALRPGHVLVFAGGEIRHHRHFALDMRVGRHRDPERTLLGHFDTAVERCTVSDVPLGVLLSGGVDSSSVAASMARLREPARVESFSIGFDEDSYDESPDARRVANFLGTTHRERRVRGADLVGRIPEIAARFDEPFGDPSFLPMYLLCEFAREHVTVALGGDGSDELLYGYAPFRADTAAEAFVQLPVWLQSAAGALAAALPVRSSYMSFDFIARRFVAGAAAARSERHPRWLSSTLPGSADDPLHPELRIGRGADVVLEHARTAYEEPRDAHHLQRVSHQYATTYLPGDILHKLDRASMAHGLELRSPFLDRDWAQFAASLPPRSKLGRGGRTKAILKDAMRSRLPRAILERSKQGFAVPMARWLRGPLLPLTDQLLSHDRISAARYFDPAVVTRLRDEHQSGRRDHRKLLWTLMAFELWRETHSIGGR